MEKYCRRSLWPVSSCSVPWYKPPLCQQRARDPHHIYTVRELREPREVCLWWWLNSATISFCYDLSWWDLLPQLRQTPFWTRVNQVKICVAPSGREITNQKQGSSGIWSYPRCSQVASCFPHQTLLSSHKSINKFWRKERENLIPWLQWQTLSDETNQYMNSSS